MPNTSLERQARPAQSAFSAKTASLPLCCLADFKRFARPGAQFLRLFPGTDIKPRLVTVAHAQTNAIAFPTGEATAETIARVAEHPYRCGSWFWFPKAGACRFEDGEMTVLDQEGRPIIAFRPVSTAASSTAPPSAN